MVSNLSCIGESLGKPYKLKIPDIHSILQIRIAEFSMFLRGLTASHPLTIIRDPLICSVSLILQMKKVRPQEVKGLVKVTLDR